MSATTWVWVVTAAFMAVSFGVVLVGLAVEKAREIRAGTDDR